MNKFFCKITRYLLLVSSIVLLNSCAHNFYEGPSMSPDQVASLSTSGSGNSIIRSVTVDGIKYKNNSGDIPVGEHQLIIEGWKYSDIRATTIGVFSTTCEIAYYVPIIFTAPGILGCPIAAAASLSPEKTCSAAYSINIISRQKYKIAIDWSTETPQVSIVEGEPGHLITSLDCTINSDENTAQP